MASFVTEFFTAHNRASPRITAISANPNYHPLVIWV
jgi:hypothetical protein